MSLALGTPLLLSAQKPNAPIISFLKSFDMRPNFMKTFWILFAFALLSTGALQAQTLDIGSVANSRGALGWTLDGTSMSATLQKLQNPANFGAGGTFAHATTITHVSGSITQAVLSPFDVFFIGWFPDGTFTNAELQAMYNWVNNGGHMLITADDPNHDAVATYFGYPSTSAANSPHYPVAGQTNHPVFTSPFGTLSSFNSGGAIGYFSNPSGATILAKDAYGTKVTLMEKNVGAGKIIFSSDVDMFTTAYGAISSGNAISNNNDKLMGNIFAYLYGCADADGDGVCDALDGCPNDANKTAPGACGCGVADVPTTWYADTDGDGAGDPNSSQAGYTCIQPPGYVANSNDQCPNDGNKTAPGVCGCGVADVATTWYADADGDGAGDPNSSQAGYTCIQPPGYVANSNDQCPADGNKTAPGVCGCGVADTDSDGDGVADCIDNCIETANASQTDGDGDGIGDVCDACPTINDPNCAGCGNGKYLVCHLPAGNPENMQQLCLPYNSALTHIGNHGGCFWGTCEGSSGMIMHNDDGPAATDDQPQHVGSAGSNNPLIETARGTTYFFEIAPNPATEAFYIHLHGHTEGAHLYVRDQLGQLIWSQPVSPLDSEFTVSLSDSRFSAGTYFVTILTNGETITRQLVVVK
jgi:hypothetical protein